MTEQLSLFGLLPEYSGHVSKHPVYSVWKGMLQRCYNPNQKQFKDYGGRGISVCDEWRNSPRSFVSWAIKAGWQSGLQIDRENNDGNYSPANCRFVLPVVNANNRRGTHYLRDGKPLRPAIRAAGVCEGTVRYRIAKGETPDDALSRPPALNARRLYLSDGTPFALAVKKAVVSEATARSRVNAGWSVDDALAIPVIKQERRVLPDGTRLSDASARFGLSVKTANSRVRRGLSPSQAVALPLRARKYFLTDGTPFGSAIASSGVPSTVAYARLRRGWSPDDAVSVPKGGKRPSPVLKGGDA